MLSESAKPRKFAFKSGRKPILWASFILFLATVSLGSCNKSSSPGAANGFRPYSIQHAILHFEYFGSTRGTEDMYIDSFGRWEAHYTHSERITQDAFKPTITLAIKHGSMLTVVDSGRNQSVRFKDQPVDSLYRLSDFPSPEEEFANSFLKSGFQAAGDTVRLGIRMQIFEMANQPVKMYEWHGILVGKRVGPPGLGDELRLMSIDTTTPIDIARFLVPQTWPVHDIEPGELLPGAKPGQAPPTR